MAGSWRRGCKQAGVQADLAPPLCTPDGLARLRKLTAAKARPWLVAACGPEIHAGFFQALAGEAPLPVVDVRSCADLETALGALTLALETREPPEITAVPVCREVLVVGGGVGGCQAALDLANAGFTVYLAESSLSIGGTMAQLDKTFPTLDCSICILGPKLVEVAAHPNIELLSYASLSRIAGQAGSFEVEVTIKPRYVNMSKCVGCGTCTTVCPVIVPSRWNLGLKPRKCIRIIFAQAVPLRATIEKDYCIDCQMCVAACEHQAINLLYRPSQRRLTVGAIVLATGARPFDPSHQERIRLWPHPRGGDQPGVRAHRLRHRSHPGQPDNPRGPAGAASGLYPVRGLPGPAVPALLLRLLLHRLHQGSHAGPGT